MDEDPQGKCGFCKKGITFVEIENILACDRPDGGYKMFSYVCPWCKAILGCQLDPIALKSETVSEITRPLTREIRQV